MLLPDCFQTSSYTCKRLSTSPFLPNVAIPSLSQNRIQFAVALMPSNIVDFRVTSTSHTFFMSMYLCMMAPHSSTLAWKIPWMEEPSRLQSVGLQRVGCH